MKQKICEEEDVKAKEGGRTGIKGKRILIKEKFQRQSEESHQSYESWSEHVQKSAVEGLKHVHESVSDECL